MPYIDTIIRTCLNSYIVVNEGAVGKTYDHTSCQIIHSFHFIPKKPKLTFIYCGGFHTLKPTCEDLPRLVAKVAARSQNVMTFGR